MFSNPADFLDRTRIGWNSTAMGLQDRSSQHLQMVGTCGANLGSGGMGICKKVRSELEKHTHS